MRKIAIVAIIVGLLSLLLGIISRITLTPLFFGLEANAFLRFTNTCLLLSIALSLLK